MLEFGKAKKNINGMKQFLKLLVKETSIYQFSLSAAQSLTKKNIDKPE